MSAVATPPTESAPVRPAGDVKRRTDSTSKEWDSHAQEWLAKNSQRLWRRHSDAVNTSLLDKWLPAGKITRILKTDLFDEAVSDGLYPLLSQRADNVEALDVSPVVLSIASRKYPAMHAFGADIRSLSCESNSIDVVVSLSTLDHFESADDIEAGLAELYRVVKPGGTLIVTMDNRANPIVAIRNRLPYRITHRLGLVPYPVGMTYRPGELCDAVASAGFIIDQSTTILHAPRVIAIPLLNAIDNRLASATHTVMLRAMMAFEVLGVLPSRPITGHFTAVRAIKPMKMRLQLERERRGA